MADEEHLRILLQGVDTWNHWRREHPDIRPDLSEANLEGANLRGADLSEADLWRAHLWMADLSGAFLHEAFLSEADLHSAYLIEADLGWANLSAANLSAAYLRGAKLAETQLGGAKLGGAYFREANLSGANLSVADLSVADLGGATLANANLGGANLSKANLTQANLKAVTLSQADFSEAMIGQTVFAGVDLSTPKGLESVHHVGPSTIGVDTIYRSKGNIPEVFLRGCGVPDDFITYIRSLVGRAIEFYSCFISYSSRDQEFAERLHNDLQAKGVRCWYAPEDVQGGRKLYEQIDEAIRTHEKLLLVLSENSMASEWVKTEIRRAREEEVKAGRRKLFPISLAPFSAIRDWEAFDADIGKDMAVEVREYFIPDFSSWKDHDAYRKAFDRLLRDLKTETALAPKPEAEREGAG